MMRTLVILGLFLLTACSTTPETTEAPNAFFVSATEDQEDNSIDESLVLAQKRAVARIRARIIDDAPVMKSEGNPESVVGAKAVEHKYLMETKEGHPKVKKWIKYYSVKDRKRFQRFLNRGAKYKQVIQDLLVANGLPPDLYYLGILESGYVTEARSHAGAVGPWQFMGPTGRQYGLKINNYVDERQDPIRSTMAAIRYLKELYRLKKSWYLALAAYNAGPGRVRRAIRRGGVRNYWSLTRRRLLPYDTREYIPQFLAILTIGKNLEKYNFVENPKKYLQPMELVKVPSPVKFKRISQITGLNKDQIEELNPHLFKNMTPPGKKKYYHLWVPKSAVTKTEASYAKLQDFRVKGLKLRRRYVTSTWKRVHRVRRGQNLSSIARRYGTSVRKIKRLNGLHNSRIYVGQRLKVKGRVRSSARYKRFHRVRRGENLTLIARKYGTTVGKLKRMNGMRGGRIFVGQKLKLMPGKAIAKKRVRRYRIRRGDNLSKIAKQFGLTIRKLKKLNNLRSNRILRGQYLKVAAN